MSLNAILYSLILIPKELKKVLLMSLNAILYSLILDTLKN